MNYWSGLKRRLRGEDKAWWSLFRVAFDDSCFVVTERRILGRDLMITQAWSDVRAVCFTDGGLGSDVFSIHLSSDGSDTPVTVPVEAEGGQVFWEELRRRQLFPDEVSGQAVRSTVSGSRFWWPPIP